MIIELLHFNETNDEHLPFSLDTHTLMLTLPLPVWSLAQMDIASR